MYLFLLIGIRFVIVASARMTANLTVRVVDGFDCLPELVPYLVSLQTTYQQVYCGASLVHPYWVVTAAHCCTLSASEYTVYTGLSEMVFSELSHAQTARIKTVIKHKGFTIMPWSSDICLLELETPLRETEKTKFVRIPTPSEYDQLAKQRRCNMSLALGFGYRSIVHANGTAEPNLKSRLLQCVFQRVMTDDYCSKGIAFIDGDTVLCTHGNPVVTADTCQGDSGGPLLCQGFQIGIVAAGMGCGLGHESYFTKLAAFYDYIWDHAPVENLGRLVPASIKTINSQIFCGGSVLSKYWVLTAGHCCSPSRAAQYIVYTGLGERRGIVQRSTVREKILHPDFSTFPLSSDICLLKLYKPIRQNARTVFIKIANTALYNEMIQSGICNHSLTLGFGTQNKLYRNLTEEHRKYNPKLQCIYQKIMPHNYCAGNALIDRTILCTLSSMDSEEADVCKGDSGGPLVCQQVQIGIVSSGRGCGIGTPSFFTRVDVFSDFISEYTNGSSNWLTTFAFIVFTLVFMNI